MPRIAPWLIAAALAFAACKPSTPVPSGDVAAQLTVPTTAGAPFDPATLKGKPALVVFWWPGCGHCRAELPDAARAAQAHGVPAVAVQIAGAPEAGAAFLSKVGWTGPALVDDGRLKRAFAIRNVPYALVLRADGTAKTAMVGRHDYDTLAGAIRAAM